MDTAYHRSRRILTPIALYLVMASS